MLRNELLNTFNSGNETTDKENFSNNPDNSDLETSASGGNCLPVDKSVLWYVNCDILFLFPDLT